MNLLAHGTNDVGLKAILTDNDKPTSIWTDSAFDAYTYLWDQAKLFEYEEFATEKDAFEEMIRCSIESGIMACIGTFDLEVFVIVTDKDTVEDLEDDTSDEYGNMIEVASRVWSGGFNAQIKKIYKYEIRLIDLIATAHARYQHKNQFGTNFCGYIHEDLEDVVMCLNEDALCEYTFSDYFDIDNLIDVTGDYL